MIAVDTNVLVYAYREDGAHHAQAVAALQDLVSGPPPWAVPVQCPSDRVEGDPAIR